MKQLLDVSAPYRWALTLSFVLLITTLSLTPGHGSPDDSVFVWLLVNTAKPVQKLMHVISYAALAVLWMWTLSAVRSRAQRIAVTLLLTVALGLVLEVLQLGVAGRFGTISDVLLNVIGAIAGSILAIIVL